MYMCITRETLFLQFYGECFIRFWNSNYVDMYVDVEIKLYQHVDMEKPCRPQHYNIHTKNPVRVFCLFVCIDLIFCPVCLCTELVKQTLVQWLNYDVN